jgi:hypothetical protein
MVSSALPDAASSVMPSANARITRFRSSLVPCSEAYAPPAHRSETEP